MMAVAGWRLAAVDAIRGMAAAPLAERRPTTTRPTAFYQRINAQPGGCGMSRAGRVDHASRPSSLRTSGCPTQLGHVLSRSPETGRRAEATLSTCGGRDPRAGQRTECEVIAPGESFRDMLCLAAGRAGRCRRGGCDALRGYRPSGRAMPPSKASRGGRRVPVSLVCTDAGGRSRALPTGLAEAGRSRRPFRSGAYQI
jgi:hypothetical protein